LWAFFWVHFTYTAAIAFWHIHAAFRPGELADGVIVIITYDGGFSHWPALSALDSAKFWLMGCISNIYCTIHTLLEVYEPYWA